MLTESDKQLLKRAVELTKELGLDDTSEEYSQLMANPRLIDLLSMEEYVDEANAYLTELDQPMKGQDDE